MEPDAAQQFPFLSDICRYFLGSLLGLLAQISGGMAALILYVVIIQNTAGSVKQLSPANKVVVQTRPNSKKPLLRGEI